MLINWSLPNHLENYLLNVLINIDFQIIIDNNTIDTIMMTMTIFACHHDDSDSDKTKMTFLDNNNNNNNNNTIHDDR